MKIIQIIHNPTAGDAQHSKESLINMVLRAGHEYSYASTDEAGWKDFYQNKRDAFLVAGGDGTVRKLAVELLTNPLIQRKPILLLPLGTANNISETLRISTESILSQLDLSGNIKKFDCGLIQGLDKETYFLEGLGFGIFPALIAEMDKSESNDLSPAEELNHTLEVLLSIVKEFKAKKAKIKVDGMKIKGSFLLVELLNIKTIGPKLKLNPNADPGDSYFELVMIPDEGRDELINYLENIIAGKSAHADMDKFVKTIRVKTVKMKWKGTEIHVDDDIVKGYSGKSFTAEVIPSALEFLV